MSYQFHVTLGDETRIVHFFVRPNRQSRPRKRQLNELCTILSLRFGTRIDGVAYREKNRVEIKIRNDKHLGKVASRAKNVVYLFAVRGQKRLVIDDSDESANESNLCTDVPDKVVDLGFTRGLPLCLTKPSSSL